MSDHAHLYWQDAYRRDFDAEIIAVTDVDGRPAAILDGTCFYPTSGGQPHDTGTLGGVAVVDVVELPEGIAHVLEKSLERGPVHGCIDWERRIDHMQQHTGQHILSRAFESALGAETVSFHLGSDVSTIDVTLSDPRAQDMARVEALANGVVFENRPVEVQEYAPSELAQLALRRAPDVDGPVRVVTIADFDACPCGGTHVRATGEVGCIHVRGWSRQRDGIRVEFLCGARAAADYRLRDQLLQTVASTLTVGVDEVSDAIDRLREAESSSRKEVEGLRRRLLELEVPQLDSEVEHVAGLHLLVRVLDEWDAGAMRYIAQSLTRSKGVIALLATSDPSPQICFARSSDLDLDMGALLREAAGPFGGRGGGRPHMAQGGGVEARDLIRVLDAAREILTARR